MCDWCDSDEILCLVENKKFLPQFSSTPALGSGSWNEYFTGEHEEETAFRTKCILLKNHPLILGCNSLVLFYKLILNIEETR